MELIQKWKQLNAVQKGIIEQIAFYTGLAILALLCWGTTSLHVTKYNNIQQNNKRIENIALSNRFKHQKKIQKIVMSHMNVNNDPIMKSIRDNRFYNEEPQPNIKKFFETYYDYNSAQDYNNRTKKLRNIVTPNVLKDKALFYKQSINKQNSIISNISSTSMSHGTNKDNLLVECYDTTWDANNSQTTGDGEDKHNEAQWYKVTYDTQNHKLTQVQNLYTNKNANSNNTDTTSTKLAGSGVNY